MGIKEDMKETAEKLRQQRDELSVQVHLASMEVRDEWEEFSSKNKHFYKEVEPALGDIQAALSLLGDELKAGYKKIKQAL